MTDVRLTIDDYLERLDEALRVLHEREREELLAEVRTHLEDAAARSGDPDSAVRAAVRSLGDPAALAQRLHAGDDEAPAQERVGRVLGMPYNFRPLSAEQVASRVWNTSDPRILMPRVFGIGWTFNFGAIAVRLGLVRPDDEEPIPFVNVPDRALWTGVAVLTAIDLATALVAWLLRDLPRPVPVHWGLVGPDRFASPEVAALWFLGPVLVLNALALVRFASGASRTARALWVGTLTLTVLLLDGIYLNGLVWARTGRLLVFAGAPVLAGLVGAFAVLVVYSRLGIRASWREARTK